MAVQRKLKVAQALARVAEKKRAKTVRSAIEFDTAKTADSCNPPCKLSMVRPCSKSCMWLCSAT